MDLEDLKDKIPTVSEIVENGEKVADKFEEKPTGSFVYIILVLLIVFSIYQHFDKKELRKQLNASLEENKYFARRSFEMATQNRMLHNTVKIQDTAIKETKSYLQDSVKVVKIKQ